MAEQIMLKKGNFTKKSYIGFSWTVFFFGFFVPLFRGDLKGAGVLLLLNIIMKGIINLYIEKVFKDDIYFWILIITAIISVVFLITVARLYNKIYTRNLLKSGWEAVDEETKELLISNGYIEIDI